MAAPLASAGPLDGCHAGTVCVIEWEGGTGSCDSEGYEAGGTSVSLLVDDYEWGVGGFSECGQFGSYTYEESRFWASVYGPVLVTVIWGSYSAGDEGGSVGECYLLMISSAGGYVQPCPGDVGPPAPGWGSLVP